MERLAIIRRVRVAKDDDPAEVLVRASLVTERTAEEDRYDQGNARGIGQEEVESSNERNEHFRIRQMHSHQRYGSDSDILRQQQQQQYRSQRFDEDNARRQTLAPENGSTAVMYLMEEELTRLKQMMEARQDDLDKLRDELSRKNREISALNTHVETLNEHLQAARAVDSQTFLHTKKDTVVETEGLKARLSRAERERDALIIQLQEIERRARMERDEEAALREELTARAAENERKAAYAELQRGRAEAEAGAARQQIEHWRSAARAAQDEVAALRAQVDTLRELVFRQSATLTNHVPTPIQSAPSLQVPFAPSSTMPAVAVVNPKESMRGIGGESVPDSEAAIALLRRQQQKRMEATSSNGDPRQSSPISHEEQPKLSPSAARRRLNEIGQELQRLDDAMENIGPPAGRTLQQRLQREQLRRQMDELNREAAALKLQLGVISQ